MNLIEKEVKLKGKRSEEGDYEPSKVKYMPRF